MARRSFPVSLLHAQNGSACTIPNSRVTLLKGHTSDVYNSAWHPERDILASVSGDATARLWDLSRRRRRADISNHKILTHYVDRYGNETAEIQDVIALEWSHDGNLLATGCCHGYARLWNRSGVLQKTLFEHNLSIMNLRWNKRDTRLLTCSGDKTVAMWHVKTGILSQKFEFHSGTVFDVDWKTDACFASGSKDRKIHVCELDQFEPVRTFRGHLREVNSIRWDPQRKLLASSSDDRTVKLWSMNSENFVRSLTGHTKSVGVVRWSPTGPRTNNPNARLHLASASLDRRVRMWDVETGMCRLVLSGHTGNVFSMAFNHDGKFFASSSFDRSVRIWSVDSGALLQKYSCRSGIFNVSWNSNGTLLSIGESNGTVTVLDLRS